MASLVDPMAARVDIDTRLDEALRSGPITGVIGLIGSSGRRPVTTAEATRGVQQR